MSASWSHGESSESSELESFSGECNIYINIYIYIYMHVYYLCIVYMYSIYCILYMYCIYLSTYLSLCII